MLRIDKENDYYIDFCDSKCIALMKKTVTQKGKLKRQETFALCGYYGNLVHLLHGYVNEIGKEPAGSTKEIIERLKKVQKTIDEISEMTKADFKSLMTEKGKKGKKNEDRII